MGVVNTLTAVLNIFLFWDQTILLGLGGHQKPSGGTNRILPVNRYATGQVFNINCQSKTPVMLFLQQISQVLSLLVLFSTNCRSRQWGQEVDTNPLPQTSYLPSIATPMQQTVEAQGWVYPHPGQATLFRVWEHAGGKNYGKI